MKTWLDLAIPLIQRWEGCRLAAYQCPAGVWTVGWGQTGPNIKRGTRWTQEQADAALASALQAFSSQVNAAIKVPLSSGEKAAVVSLAYNIGIGSFKKSTLLRLLNEGQFAAAAKQFARWNRAGGEVLRGLSNRRAAERALFLGIKDD